ncbi:MAG TPA: ABC transporter permease [Symbiobacteriaceae bacterium]|nr:ABC transporter permease [Symbiobacteriaceae bacterium]
MNSSKRLLRLVAGPVVAVAAAFVIGAVLIALAGVDPLVAYQALFLGAFGNKNAVAETLIKAAPLTLAGLGVMFAFRTNTFNIGAEGQLYFGGLATTAVAIALPDLPRAIMVPVLILAAAIGGGLWAAIPAYLKATRGSSEIILTIMLNYVAILFVGFLLQGPLQAPGSNTPISPLIPANAQAPIIWAGTRLHASVLLAVLVAIGAYVLLWHTSIGLKMRAVGDTPGTAQAVGIPVTRMVVLSMAISGALAGLAGLGEITGVHQRLLSGFSPNYGTTAIAVALLGKLNPVGVVLSGIFFAALRTGADTMQRWVAVPASLSYVLQGMVVLFVLAGAFMHDTTGLAARLKGAFGLGK